jgi:two-component system, sensor histidine kinase PdtaS
MIRYITSTGLLILLIFMSRHSLAQPTFEQIWQEGMEKTSDTSSIDFLLDKIWDLARIDPQLSLSLLNELNSRFYQRSVLYKQDVWLYYMGVIHKNLGHYEESDHYFSRYYQFHQERENKANLAAVQMARANLYSDRGLWSKSMEAVTESLRYYESLNDSLGMIRASSKLGFILFELKRIDDALPYHHRALDFAIAIKDTAEISIAYSNIGLAYEKKEKNDTALIYYQRSFNLDQQTDDQFALLYDQYNLGNIYRKMENYPLALSYTEKAWEGAKKVGSRAIINYSQTLLGSIYIKLDQTRKGIDLLKDLIESATIQSTVDLSDIHANLYLGYKEIGDIPSAFHHLEIYHELSDSLLNQNITQQINNLEIEYQTEKTRQELALANSEKEIAELKLDSFRFRLYFLLGVLLLISGLLYYLYRLNRQVKDQNLIISRSLKEKEVLLKEIHHRVKNNLQVISSILSLQSKAEDDPNVISALKLGQNRVRSMALIHQNLYEENNLTGIEVKQYFDKLTRSLFHSYNISPDRIRLETDIQDLHLDVETVIPLGLIVNELITNSLKYAFPGDLEGTIKVKLQESNGILRLDVTDNGIGWEQQPEKTGKSFGYRLINAFKQQLKAQLDIDSTNGTSVHMLIREYRKTG